MGLEMIRSRIDSRIETYGATSYTEWTMEFENKAFWLAKPERRFAFGRRRGFATYPLGQ